MSRSVHACEPEARLDAAARMMWDFDIGVVPVVDRERRLVGIITDRDIAMAGYLQGQAQHEISIASAMNTRVITCRSRDAVEEAEKAMAEHQVHRLPVVDENDVLVGIVSLSDLARATAGRGKKGIKGTEVAETLRAISEPRA